MEVIEWPGGSRRRGLSWSGGPVIGWKSRFRETLVWLSTLFPLLIGPVLSVPSYFLRHAIWPFHGSGKRPLLYRKSWIVGRLLWCKFLRWTECYSSLSLCFSSDCSHRSLHRLNFAYFTSVLRIVFILWFCRRLSSSARCYTYPFFWYRRTDRQSNDHGVLLCRFSESSRHCNHWGENVFFPFCLIVICDLLLLSASDLLLRFGNCHRCSYKACTRCVLSRLLLRTRNRRFAADSLSALHILRPSLHDCINPSDTPSPNIVLA